MSIPFKKIKWLGLVDRLSIGNRAANSRHYHVKGESFG
jgi:hypothetical protein